MNRDRKTQLRQLKALATRPDEQAGIALQLLESSRGRDVQEAALRILVRTPLPEARAVLLERFAYYAAQGEVRDRGGYMRAQIIQALRPIALPADVPLLEQAALTYEFLPPGFQEESGQLRAVGLVVLNDLDDSLARFHAARLLAEPYTNTMSGEPAATAVRVLASQQELLPLYAYLQRPDEQTLPELISECLRHLTTLPDSLLPQLIGRYAKNTNELVLAGLFDLLLGHQTGPHGQDFLFDFLETTHQYDAYRYLVSLLVTSRSEELLNRLLDVIRFEQHRQKLEILVEALAPLAYDSEIAELTVKLEARIR